MSHLHIPHIHFYPRPPRGGRPACIADRRVSSVFLSTPSARRATRRPGQEGSRVQISIHALREEGDGAFPSPMCVDRRFLSTPSARRATFHLCHHGIFPVISIHALREEGDLAVANLSVCPNRFLSTPSARRATAGRAALPWAEGLFLSTPSARRATLIRRIKRSSLSISIHALREEGDRGFHEGRTGPHHISIHALREEGDAGAGVL